MENTYSMESKVLNNSINPISVIYKVFLIVILSILIGLIIPGFVAYLGGVFYKEDIKLRLPLKQRNVYKKYELSLSGLDSEIRDLDSLIKYNKYQERYLLNIISLRNQYYKDLHDKKPPFQLAGYYLNSIMLVWVAMYIALLCLIQLFSPGPNAFHYLFKKFIYTVKIAAGIYIAYQWTVWMRNFVLSDEGRIVYSFANYDIFPGSFFMQEINTIIFAMLLSILWQQWNSYYLNLILFQNNKFELENRTTKFTNIDTKNISFLFVQWQIMSIILALGFIEFTSAFWDLVVGSQDKRYIIAAIVIHTLWGITWLLISLPLLVTWYSWQTKKAEVLVGMINNTYENEEVNTFTKIIGDIKPIGIWNIASSGLAAAVSFVLPIIQAFIK